MNETVEKLVTSVKGVKAKMTAALVEGVGIERMTADDLVVVQMIYELLNNLCDVIEEQSEAIEQLSCKVNLKAN